MDDRSKLVAAFRALRKLGYIAKMNFACCGSCASYEIWSSFDERGVPEADRKAVYWNRQSDDAFRPDRYAAYTKTRDLHFELPISWAGDPTEIIRALSRAGLKVRWEGDVGHCIMVVP